MFSYKKRYPLIIQREKKLANKEVQRALFAEKIRKQLCSRTTMQLSSIEENRSSSRKKCLVSAKILASREYTTHSVIAFL